MKVYIYNGGLYLSKKTAAEAWKEAYSSFIDRELENAKITLEARVTEYLKGTTGKPSKQTAASGMYPSVSNGASRYEVISSDPVELEISAHELAALTVKLQNHSS